MSSDSRRILIVDDQREVREYVRRVLEEKGYEVLEAEDPDSGLKVFDVEGESLALAILDLDFGPGVPGGLDLLSRMKKNNPEVPVLILTPALFLI